MVRPSLHTAFVSGHEGTVWYIRDKFGVTNMLVTTNEMGDSLASTIGKGKAALMRGHGSVVTGKTVQDAVFTTFYLRLNAEVLIKAMSIGGTITYLSAGEIEQSGELHNQAAAQGRAWEDWCSQAGVSGISVK
jgi:HCOMODA/2-hydroxy-3-carboxy-muconic semialdehyde decarboxylase